MQQLVSSRAFCAYARRHHQILILHSVAACFRTRASVFRPKRERVSQLDPSTLDEGTSHGRWVQQRCKTGRWYLSHGRSPLRCMILHRDNKRLLCGRQRSLLELLKFGPKVIHLFVQRVELTDNVADRLLAPLLDLLPLLSKLFKKGRRGCCSDQARKENS